MSIPLIRTTGLVLSAFLCVPALAAPPEKLAESALAAKVDALLAARWKKDGIVPAPLTDDAAFIRRAFLDLAGRIPSILEVRDFLDDDRPDKRRLWTDDLLRGIRRDAGSDYYSDHFATVWGETIIPPTSGEQAPGFSLNLQLWLRQQFRRNAPMDEMVRQIVGGRGAGEAASFYQVNESKPENLAAATTRLFLGVKLECAQCHDDRSGGSWSREQFWELAAFFSGGRSLDIPGTKRRVDARFLDGSKPKDQAESTPAGLADWVTSPANPWFARATINRVWGFLFGVGLVDPVEEFGELNPPSHPEVLDLLAGQFVAHKFDLKYLLRSLVLTRAYQLSSLTTHPSQDKPRTFARMNVRGLSPAQLFDSLAEAMEYRAERAVANLYSDPARRLSPREDFLNRFYTQERGTEVQTSILQALYLMNGTFVTRAASLEQNRTLQTIADAAKIDTGRRLETLFLVALSRKPTERELKKFGAYVDRGGPTGDAKKALADIFWALLNSAEFRLNH